MAKSAWDTYLQSKQPDLSPAQAQSLASYYVGSSYGRTVAMIRRMQGDKLLSDGAAADAIAFVGRYAELCRKPTNDTLDPSAIVDAYGYATGVHA